MRVHGPGAVVDDGPFKLTVDDLWPDRGILVGVEGDDDTRSLHFVDDLSKKSLCGDEPDGETLVYKVRPKSDAGDQEQLLADLQVAKESRALHVQLSGAKAFMAEFVWYEAPTVIDDMPVSLWLSVAWLVEYLWPQDDSKRGHRGSRVVEHLRDRLEAVGFSPDHCIRSRLTRKRLHDAAQDGELDETHWPEDALISMVGVFVLLESLATNARWTRGNKDDIPAKARTLFAGLVRWPFLSSCGDKPAIAFASPRSNCQVLLVDDIVDYETLAATYIPDVNKKLLRTVH